MYCGYILSCLSMHSISFCKPDWLSFSFIYLLTEPPADDGSSKAHGRVGGTGKVLPPTRPPASPGDFVDIKKGKLEGQQPSKVIPLRVNDLGVDFRPEGKDLIPEIRKQLSQQHAVSALQVS